MESTDYISVIQLRQKATTTIQTMGNSYSTALARAGSSSRPVAKPKLQLLRGRVSSPQIGQVRTMSTSSSAINIVVSLSKFFWYFQILICDLSSGNKGLEPVQLR